jgi:hypothetical protein
VVAVAGVFACELAVGAETTYHRDVVPILQKHCQDCHRPGQVAPFSLLSYEHARKRAADIVTVVADRRMPPWHASTAEGGPFKDARTLTADEIKTLETWARGGAVEGDPAHAPPARHFGSEWTLGEPDLVLKVRDSYRLAAEGPDEFRVFVLPSGLTEGKWIKAVDFRPGNAKVVHHILGAYDVRGRARVLDEADPESGYRSFAGFGQMPNGTPFFPSGGLGGWAPGKMARPLSDGVGRYLPAGADVLLQIHYHRNGRVESDATAVALYFAKEPIERQVRGGFVMPPRKPAAIRPDLHIPAGADRYEVRGAMTMPYDAHLHAVGPHMHWLGKGFLLKAKKPDGTSITLIRVDHWDFNWQGRYELAQPIALPAGTRVEMVAHFDNSASNPSNPSRPPIDVVWGEQTTNEMCIGFMELTRDDEKLGNKPPEHPPLPANLDRPGALAEQLRILRARAALARAARSQGDAPKPKSP